MNVRIVIWSWNCSSSSTWICIFACKSDTFIGGKNWASIYFPSLFSGSNTILLISRLYRQNQRGRVFFLNNSASREYAQVRTGLFIIVGWIWMNNSFSSSFFSVYFLWIATAACANKSTIPKFIAQENVRVSEWVRFPKKSVDSDVSIRLNVTINLKHFFPFDLYV